MATIASVRSRSLRVALLTLVCIATAGIALVSARALRAAEPPPAATSPPAFGKPDVAKALEQAREEVSEPAPTPTPVPHEWKTDAQGIRYYVDTYSKTMRFLRLDPGHIRTVWGFPLDIDHEDAKNFYYRVYETDPNAKGPGESRKITAEMKAAYDVQTPTVDRLTFTPFDDGLPTSGQWRNNFAIADINGDGKLDIIHAPARKANGGGPVVFLGDGHGHWTRWKATFPPFPYDYGAAAVADLDGDGRPDIVLGVHLHGLVALVQKRPGVFELWNKGLPYRTSSQEPLAFSSRAIGIVDWNHDGKPDIAAIGEGPQMQVDQGATRGVVNARGVEIFLNQGNGSWKLADAGSGGAGIFGDHLLVADVDGDRRPDLLLSSMVQARSDLLVLNKKGAGTTVNLREVRDAYTPAITTADFDRDRHADLALSFLSSELGDWRTGIDLFLAQPKGAWRRSLLWDEVGHARVSALAAGDIDGDGNADLVALTGDGRVLVFLGDGKGHLAQQANTLMPTAEACMGSDVHLVDLDGDGRAEIVAEFAGEPGGMPGLASEPGCVGGGSIHVWKAAARPGG